MSNASSLRTLFVMLAGAAMACGTGQQGASVLGSDGSALTSENGLTINGLSVNGITTNGITTNGITTNGITTNGITTNGLAFGGTLSNGLATNGLTQQGLQTFAFMIWFLTAAPGYGDMVMKYLARCALPAANSLTYFDGATSHVWPGNLGLAPVWASGRSIPLVEQQLVTACLAAHANKYGVHVPVSVRGYDSTGALIPVFQAERMAYTDIEGAFFGNLFNGEGIFSAPSPQLSSVANYSGLRACALMTFLPSGCAPIISTGGTAPASCAQTYDYKGGVLWGSCTWNGKTYASLTTYLAPSYVTTCGDGVCAAPEACYSAQTGYGCLADCGACP